jgi:hypothetical protein
MTNFIFIAVGFIRFNSDIGIDWEEIIRVERSCPT